MSAGIPPRAVIDTSTLYSPGNRKAITRLAAEGTIVAIWSPWIVAELVRILTLAWIDRHGNTSTSRRQCSAAARVMMLAMEPNFLVVAPRPPYPPSCPDPDRPPRPPADDRRADQPRYDDVPLDLQLALELLFDRYRYAELLDYAVPPPSPPFIPSDARWIADRIQEWQAVRTGGEPRA